MSIAGSWTRTDGGASADAYPHHLTFDARGIYTGRREDGGFTLWDAGSWRVEGADAVRISTANDAQLLYAFTLNGDALAFRDPEGRAFAYRRAG